MAGNLKKIECDPSCGFLVRSHDENEVVRMAREHVKNIHHKDISEQDAQSMVVNA